MTTRTCTATAVAAAVALATAAGTARAAAPAYTLSDLGIPLDNAYSFASAINAAGEVTGSFAGPNGYQQPFVYSGGTLTQIPALGGRSGSGQGINNLGQVAGYGRVADPTDPLAASATHAFLYSGGTTQDLGVLGTGAISQGNAINDAGRVVGVSNTVSTGDGASHGFEFYQGQLTDLATLGGSTGAALTINSAGVAAGYALLPGDVHGLAVTWSTTGAVTSLGALPGGTDSEVYGSNDAGQFVGLSYSDATGVVQAVRFANSTVTDLGSFGGSDTEALDINNMGVAVGYGYDAGDSNQLAALFLGGQAYDLNTLVDASGWSLQDALGINDAGVIVGYGTDPLGVTHAFSLTPITSVPEPASLSLAAVGAAGLLGRRRRARR